MCIKILSEEIKDNIFKKYTKKEDENSVKVARLLRQVLN